MARVVFVVNTKLIVDERNPACFTAPPGVDQTLAVRKQGRECGAGLRRAIGEQPRREYERRRYGDLDQVGHLTVCYSGALRFVATRNTNYQSVASDPTYL